MKVVEDGCMYKRCRRLRGSIETCDEAGMLGRYWQAVQAFLSTALIPD